MLSTSSKSLCQMTTGILLLVSMALALNARVASGVTIYRIGQPFSEAERDSLEGIGIELRELGWSENSQLEDALDPDSLQVGILQPNFIGGDDDIAASMLSRGGWVVAQRRAGKGTFDQTEANALVDQDPNTGYSWPAQTQAFLDLRASCCNDPFAALHVNFNLGGRFHIREVRFRTLPDSTGHFLERFVFGAGDEVIPCCNWTGELAPVVEVKDNTEPDVSLKLDPPVTTNFVQLLILRETPKEIGLAAFELYGGGYAKQASYESDVIELDDIASLGEIRWSGRQDPRARVAIRTRAGADPHPVIFWEVRHEQHDVVRFLLGGGDLSMTEYKSQYDRLPNSDKPDPEPPKELGGYVGGVRGDPITPDTEHWSFYSRPYGFGNPGVPIVSPGPRKFVQIRVDFASTTVAEGGKLDYIEFKASVPPLVHRLVGEIHPIQTRVGEATQFTYYLSPTIRSGERSFDGVEIATPSGVVSVDSLRIAGVDQEDFSSTIHEDSLGFEVLLPSRLDSTQTGALVEVVFTAPVLREVGTEFAGRVFDTTRPHEVRQRVVPGNATDEIEGDRLSVRTALSESLVFSPRISPNPFTPNGDGVNEAANISYKLLRLTSAVPVSLEIYDLSGRQVRRVYEGEDPVGEYSHAWDGRDDSDELVPPGLYLYRLVVDVQSGKETNSGVVAVAY